jgi:ATP-dependent DNA helicase RecG
LKYDELFLMQFALALRRRRVLDSAGASPVCLTPEIDRRIRGRFPFLLTEDQDTVIGEIASDMSRNRPMNRLLQGDVGSGKTVVALYAALLAVAGGLQVAVMAPTEILASQHFISCERYLKKSRVRRVLLTGGLTGRKRKHVLDEIGSGRVDIVVGTVALLQKDVRFRRLGLVVIDEQHKFGVRQRATLRRHDGCHCLVMTATPIPRTLAMTVFGDLDVSTIRHRPPGRCGVVTRVVAPEMRLKAYDFIRQRLSAGGQAYFVYPWIAGTDEAGVLKAAADQCRMLSEEAFAAFRVELLHGRMSSERKRRVMADFRSRRIDVLVSTVVIEVGLDVPNATIMVVESAERFGLAQLHQLRGRIGRARARGDGDRSYCLLFTDRGGEAAEQRLRIMTRTNDGFEIAEEDLRIRGPGELFSTRQHGLPDLKIADIIEDGELLRMARRHAFELVDADPELAEPAHEALKKALFEKFGDSLELSRVA